MPKTIEEGVVGPRSRIWRGYSDVGSERSIEIQEMLKVSAQHCASNSSMRVFFFRPLLHLDIELENGNAELDPNG